MGKEAIGEAHIKITASGAQAVAEFNRTQNHIQRSVTKMEAEVTKLSSALSKKFTFGDIGKDIVKGLGVGSGFAVAQTAVEQVTEYFREQAEYAKQIEESTAKQLEHTMKLIAFRQTDAQQVVTLEKEAARVWRDLEAAKAKGSGTETTMGANFQVSTRSFTRPLSGEEQAKVAALTAEYNQLTDRIRVLNKEKSAQQKLDERSNEIAKDVSAFLKNTLEPQLRTEHELRKAHNERGAAIEALAEKYRELGDPMREYTRSLAQITALEKLGAINADEALSARIKVWGDRADAINARGGGSGMGDRKALDYDISSATDATVELGGAARDMGFAFASAFENAALSASSLGDIVDGLVQDIARMMLRMAIINPVMNSVFGFSGASALPTLFGGGRASGGPVASGTTYLVGEEGPELFTPRTSGTIIPNGATGEGSVVVNQTYHIGAGVTAQQLMPILSMQKRDIIATIKDAERRRK